MSILRICCGHHGEKEEISMFWLRGNSRLTIAQAACVQDICMSSSFSEALTKYLLNAQMIPNVAFVKRNDSKHGINLYEPFSDIPDIENQLYTPFLGGHVNIVNRRIVALWMASKEAMTYTERCVSFDTQTVSYLHRYYQGRHKAIPNTIEKVMQVMQIKNVGVDNIPYVTENLLFSLDKRDVVIDTLFSFEKLFYEDRKMIVFVRNRYIIS